MSVQPIPPGFHSVTPHLCIAGCAEAIEFYKKAFGAEEIRRESMPGSTKLMHASIKIGDSMLMLADDFPEFRPDGKSNDPRALGGTSVTIHIYSADAQGLYDRAVAAGCTVTMPMAEQFWGDLFGSVTDPFGHSWSIAQVVKKPTPEEMEAAMMASFAEMGKG